MDKDERIAELEVAVRRAVWCIEWMMPRVMWDEMDGDDDQNRISIYLDMVKDVLGEVSGK